MTKTYIPTSDKPWFCFDGDQHVYFSSEEDALDASNEAIAYYLNDHWDEQVGNVMVGKITHLSTKTNVSVSSDSDIAYICNYEPLPLIKDNIVEAVHKHEITVHKINDDEPIRVFSLNNSATYNNTFIIGTGDENAFTELAKIDFQNGHPASEGINGITMESLLAVCHRRLSAFQASSFPCAQNGAALEGIECAINALKERTQERNKIIETERQKGRKAERQNSLM